MRPEAVVELLVAAAERRFELAAEERCARRVRDSQELVRSPRVWVGAEETLLAFAVAKEPVGVDDRGVRPVEVQKGLLLGVALLGCVVCPRACCVLRGRLRRRGSAAGIRESLRVVGLMRGVESMRLVVRRRQE